VRFENAGLDMPPSNLPIPRRSPLRVVLDSNLALPLSAKIFLAEENGARTVVFCRLEVLSSRSEAVLGLYPDYVEVIGVAGGEAGLDLSACLSALRELGVTKVLCEGGAYLAGALLDQNLVDELYWFVAPKLLVDGQALPAVSSNRARALADLANMTVKEQRILGDDVLIHTLF
jgi:diaminohydroxyphosphoribosylaminopyrimidine deaminase/5-amino-6-(5-phosphoribosylamino)uracil reductase